MAKTKGPLLSLDAHGSLADLLTYSSKRSGSQVRKYTKPLKPASAKQRGQRRLTEFLVAQWQNMSAGDIATWEANAAASDLNLEGYHYFLREAQRNLYLHHGLVGYWHCNEIVGDQVLDLSGRGYHGTLEPDYPANAPVLVDSSKTRLGKALLYDGVDEYVTFGNNPIWRTTGYSVSLLVKGLAQKGKVIYSDGYSEDILPLFWIGTGWDDETKGRIVIRDNEDVTQQFRDTITTILDGTYHYITITDLNGDLLFYVDGIVDAKDLSYTPSTLTLNLAGLGAALRAAPTAFFKGTIDEICTYNRVLSPEEIATRYKFAK